MSNKLSVSIDDGKTKLPLTFETWYNLSVFQEYIKKVEDRAYKKGLIDGKNLYSSKKYK